MSTENTETTDPIKLAFGYSRGIPADVRTAWGARLIAPADLVWDRQDLVAASDSEKQALVAWLNGTPSGHGAIARMREELRRIYGVYLKPNERFQHVIYEDEAGMIVGNTNASYGYVYVAGWLKTEAR